MVLRKPPQGFRDVYDSLRRHFDEPHHVPDYALNDFQVQLAHFEERLSQIESRLWA